MVDVMCGPMEKRRFFLDLAYENENEDEPCRYAMMRTGMEEQGSTTSSLMESLYTCFADFRKLSAEEKTVYIAKERDRCARQIQYAMVCDTEDADLLDKIGLAMRDVYASLTRKLQTDTDADADAETSKELDVLLSDLMISTPLEAARIWIQTVSYPSFETQVLLPWLANPGIKSGETFVEGAMKEIHPRLERWIHKHNISLSDTDLKVLLDHMSRFSEMFYQCTCQWVVKYLRAVVRGDTDGTDHAAEAPVFFLNMVTAYMPFDVIVLDSDTLDVFYDSYKQMVGTAPRENTVCLIYFKKEKRFESVGIVCPPLEKDQPSRLTRLIPVEHQMVIDLRNSTQDDPKDDEDQDEEEEDEKEEDEDDKLEDKLEDEDKEDEDKEDEVEDEEDKEEDKLEEADEVDKLEDEDEDEEEDKL